MANKAKKFKKITNQKVYKSMKTDNNNILPGDLQRLPDDSFFVSKTLLVGVTNG